MSDEIKTVPVGLELFTDLCNARRERDELRAVLSDFLESRGLSWLAQLATRREELTVQLRYAQRFGDYEVCGTCHDLEPREQRSFTEGLHVARCPLASLLRTVGGPEETQRQVDAAHEAALRDVTTRAYVSAPSGYNLNDPRGPLFEASWPPRRITIRGSRGDIVVTADPNVDSTPIAYSDTPTGDRD